MGNKSLRAAVLLSLYTTYQNIVKGAMFHFPVRIFLWSFVLFIRRFHRSIMVIPTPVNDSWD